MGGQLDRQLEEIVLIGFDAALREVDLKELVDVNQRISERVTNILITAKQMDSEIKNKGDDITPSEEAVIKTIEGYLRSYNPEQFLLTSEKLEILKKQFDDLPPEAKTVISEDIKQLNS